MNRLFPDEYLSYKRLTSCENTVKLAQSHKTITCQIHSKILQIVVEQNICKAYRNMRCYSGYFVSDLYT